MYKFLITGDIDKTYDRMFNIIDKHSTLFKCSAENEYNSEDGRGYVLEFKHIPSDAAHEILSMKNVEEL